ncbi:unnamed protein product [Sphenostylis stenocarpa]|uniref:Uncharacterized protein n=1 Tax=Sphenostylis stenocarpa TaxID=92480 RepID=A0AA86SRL7_9FABA|nr:unnamed protein product [Sphenostylis stenocarpa]
MNDVKQIFFEKKNTIVKLEPTSNNNFQETGPSIMTIHGAVTSRQKWVKESE